MKTFSGLWTTIGLLLGVVVSAPGAVINGHEYVPLANWAGANGLKTVWVQRGEEVAATNRATRLLFDKDSSAAEINGVNVVLSFPAAVDKGTPLISQFDLDKTIRPLLYPTRYVTPKKITTICLDPGHGGKDTGNRVGHFFWYNEKTYTLFLALELRDQLQRAGFRVLLTRDRDTFVELPARPALANRAGADLFISLHFNSSPVDRANVQGPETYCITPVGAASSNDTEGAGAGHGASPANRAEIKSLLLAYQVQRAMAKELGVTDRGVRRARYEVLRGAEMPAILIEGGYMTHPSEGKRIFDPVYRRQLAAAMVKGILAYQKLTAPPAPPAASPSTTHAATPRTN